VRKQFFEQIDPSRRMILDGGDGAGKRTRVAGAKMVD
jgi:hypothetical protein